MGRRSRSSGPWAELASGSRSGQLGGELRLVDVAFKDWLWTCRSRPMLSLVASRLERLFSGWTMEMSSGQARVSKAWSRAALAASVASPRPQAWRASRHPSSGQFR